MPKKLIFSFSGGGVLFFFLSCFGVSGKPFLGSIQGGATNLECREPLRWEKTDTPALKDSATSELAEQDEKLVQESERAGNRGGNER